MVVSFYSLLAAASYLLGAYWLERNVFFWHDGAAIELGRFALAAEIGAGASLGLLVVLLSRLADRHFAWARELNNEFRALLGSLDINRIAIFAMASSIGEEMLFRGLLQPSIGIVWSSLIFGALHLGPNRKFMPWTLMALVLGFALGGLYYFSGNLLAPILAHFTINFFNLNMLSHSAPTPHQD